jgi:hypothetical protein
MRQRLVQVLEKDDGNEPMDVVVRRFWSRTTPLSANHPGVTPRVVDLATWARDRSKRTRP